MKILRELPHGTMSGYNYWRCRCDPCREAWNAYHRDRRERQQEEMIRLQAEVTRLRSFIEIPRTRP